MLSMATRSGRVHCHHGLLLVRRHGDSFLWPLRPVFFKCLSVLTQVPPPQPPPRGEVWSVLPDTVDRFCAFEGHDVWVCLTTADRCTG